MNCRCHISTENSIIIYFAKKPSPTLSQSIHYAHLLIKKSLSNAYIDGVASYISLSIIYDIKQLCAKQALLSIKKTLQNINSKATEKTQTVAKIQKIQKIPVFYDEKVAADLSKLLAIKKLTKSKFIQYHTQNIYDIYSIGFMPNFAYLGLLPKPLCTPRLKKPRAQIAKGSVGIADCQTGVYPNDSPAGWQIIGRTPLDLSLQGKFRFAITDKVQFISINEAQYLALGGHLTNT